MKKQFPFLSAIIAAIVLFSAFSFPGESEAIKKIDYYGDAKNAGKLLELVKAELAAKRKPVLFFTATWCGPCKQFKASLNDPLMIDAMNGCTLIMIDETIDNTKEKIGNKYKVTSYPTYIRVDANGTVKKKTDGGAWDENIPKNMAPVLKEFLK
jgi:thiol-disulfide isomerase/thioredoxin